MRTVTIKYDKDGFNIEDCDGQWVGVEWDGEKALFISELHGDEEPQFGSCHRDDAEAQALFLMGIPNEDRFAENNS